MKGERYIKEAVCKWQEGIAKSRRLVSFTKDAKFKLKESRR